MTDRQETDVLTALATAVKDLADQVTELKQDGGKRNKTRRRETGERTKMGLTPQEQDRVLAAARVYFDGDGGMSKAGALSSMTNERIEQTLYFMMYAGFHRKVIVHPVKQGLQFDGVSFQWRRPKKIGHAAVTGFEVLVERRDMARDWVEWLVARDGISLMVINRLFWQLGVDARLPVKFAPLTARHTCGCNLSRTGYPSVEISTRMNCSIRVAEGYCRMAPKEGDLAARGYTGPGTA
jgi:hypothetical protein